MANEMDLPPEYMAEIDAANRRRMLAQLLQRQALGYQGAPTGGKVAARTSPLAWAANIGTGMLGNAAASQGDMQARAAQERAASDQSAETARVLGLPEDQQFNEAAKSRFKQVQLLGKALQEQRQARLKEAMQAAGKNDPNAVIQMAQTNSYPTAPVKGPTSVVNGQLVPADALGDYRDKFEKPTLLPGAGGQMDLYQAVQGTGQVKKLDNATKISVGGAQVNLPKAQTKGMETLATDAATAVKTLGERASVARDLLGTLEQMKELDQKGMLSGVPAPVSAWISNFAQAAGAPVDTAKLANTENYRSIANDAAQKLISQYGGNRGVTKEEAAQIKEIVPQVTQSPQARMQLIAILSNVAKRSIAKYQEVYPKYIKAMQSGDFEGFDLYDTLAPGISMATLPAVPVKAAKTVPGTEPAAKSLEFVRNPATGKLELK